MRSRGVAGAVGGRALHSAAADKEPEEVRHNAATFFCELQRDNSRLLAAHSID